jgi:hypothetical protein
MGANTALCPLYAWSKRGARVRMKVPRNRGPNTTLLSSLSAEGIGPCLAAEGSTNAAVFEAYLERMLTPTLQPGQVVVMMDNLSAHKSERVKRAHRGAGMQATVPAALLAGLQSKRLSRRSRVSYVGPSSNRTALIEAMGVAILAVTAGDA